MYEHHRQPLIPLGAFLSRLARHGLVALLLAVLSLAIGMAGYHQYEHQAWDMAFLNAAMLLGGMGPVGEITTRAGRVFAGLYALYAGMIFVVVAALLLTPVMHRLLHRFHLEAGEESVKPPVRPDLGGA